ncbi:hypothetical protein [Nocardioides sp. AE5]|uniref:hypothetical protein n=1 Tax=Nocardioides sp. AE5 TaxID=2962573 RepID=UPI002881AB3C|nr:hypothetical protein [Nocardioides sp. AE5]MDT0202960.1 hypothetical protein [Nocardioides sp. AE5]
MVSMELRASVDALSDAERIELLAYIEGTLDLGTTPSEKQHALAAQRLDALKTDASLGLSIDQAIAAARHMTA